MRFYTVSACSTCHGEGRRVEKNCGLCKGRGAVGMKEKVRVSIPAGIEDDMHIRLDGMGEAGTDGAGDLYVRVNVQNHKIFKREGEDIYLELPVSFGKAALGAEIEVPTLFGKGKLRIPAGIESHTVFRLKGEGLPHLRGGRKGDELVRLIIQVPKNLNSKQKKLLEEFEEESRNKKGFFDGVF